MNFLEKVYFETILDEDTLTECRGEIRVEALYVTLFAIACIVFAL